MSSFGEICRLLWIRWFNGKDHTTGMSGRTHFMSKKRSGIAGLIKKMRKERNYSHFLNYH
jgi:hypothetical protein